ncbi:MULTISPECIES: DUF1348 family protein [Flavobacteriaceae]|uniref:DUF1348 family protein n=1 Tax=Flavobacteriaceae TaxID=49546 RepID=UPI00234AB003|nr:DUF1348 family protein [Muricauda sp. SP22]MDC6363316.1 DUF1348 family protein [Muricauda sp. SP22]
MTYSICRTKNRHLQLEYEYPNAEGAWFRANGNENWEFNEHGLMQRCYVSINDLQITETERRL